MKYKDTRIGKCHPEFDVSLIKNMIDKNDAGTWGIDPLEDGYPVVRSTNYNDTGYLDLSDVAIRYLDEDTFAAKQLLEDEIIIERSGGSDTQPVGRVSFITTEVAEKRMAFANFIQRVSAKGDIHPKYLFYCLYQMHSAGFTQTMQNQTNGIRNLEYRFFLKQTLPKPKYKEQERIASVISSVDNSIIATKKSIAHLKDLKKSFIQNLLTGKIKPNGSVRDEVEFYEHQKYGRVPIGWQYKRFGEVAIIIAGQSPSGDTYNFDGNGFPILNGPSEFTDVFPVVVQYTTKPTKFSEPGDILFCVRGSTTGRMNWSDRSYCIGRGIAAIRNKENSDIKFIYYTLQLIVKKIFAIAKSSGTTFPNVTRDELLKNIVLFPTTQ